MRGPQESCERQPNPEPDWEALLPEMYNQLRWLAHKQFGSASGWTLQPTALIHEAFLRLKGRRGLEWRSRTHFFAIAAQEVRRVLVDQWRRRNADRRGGGMRREGADCLELLPGGEDRAVPYSDLVALDEALNALAAVHPRPARVVELSFFTGLTQVEIADLLGLSRKTIAADWAFARSWLMRELTR
ncbi:MAG: ECF-type sigma factor [Planctomycetota bacterium]